MGREERSEKSLVWRRIGAVIAGLGFFVPAFLLSFAMTCTWAEHHWPGDGQAAMAAFDPAVVIAAILTMICCMYLLRRVELDRNRNKK